ncbi:MAG: hypothetical protein Q4G59_04115 [Planctomycetia bacterium]|nr:hypothetical protein [Planctomycetia bacterium]
MGFLKQFFRTVFRDGTLPSVPGSFEDLRKSDLEKHLAISRYGNFELTDAIRPSFNLKVVPIEGFRFDIYRDEIENITVPVAMGAVSKDKLFDTFMDLLDPLGEIVDVILESSHSNRRSGHLEHIRESIDLPVLKSILYDYEDFLMNDGCTGIAVLNPTIPQEVQFDEHKLLIVYGEDAGTAAQRIFGRHRVTRRDSMRFVTEAEHVHSTRQSYRQRYDELRMRLAMDQY